MPALPYRTDMHRLARPSPARRVCTRLARPPRAIINSFRGRRCERATAAQQTRALPFRRRASQPSRLTSPGSRRRKAGALALGCAEACTLHQYLTPTGGPKCGEAISLPAPPLAASHALPDHFKRRPPGRALACSLLRIRPLVSSLTGRGAARPAPRRHPDSDASWL
jgi:hypothetical protein